MLREKGNSSFLRPQTRDKCCKCLDKDLAVPGQRLPWQHLTLKIWFSFSSHEENVTTYVKELWEEFLLTVLFCCRIKALLLEDALWGHHAAGYYWDNECSSQWPRGLWKSVSSLCVWRTGLGDLSLQALPQHVLWCLVCLKMCSNSHFVDPIKGLVVHMQKHSKLWLSSSGSQQWNQITRLFLVDLYKRYQIRNYSATLSIPILLQCSSPHLYHHSMFYWES